MLKIHRMFLVLFLLLFACATPPPAPPQPILTSIKVVMDNNYPPYTFLDNNGQPQGILIDEWNLWEQKTGIKVELTSTDWIDAQRRMQTGEFDVIDTIFYNETRAQIYDFSRPYADLDVPIFFRRNISGITNAASLKGFPVAVKAGDAAIEVLKQAGVDQFLEYNSYEAILQAARDQRVVIFVVDQPPAEYFLYKYGIQDQFNFSAPLYTGQFHRAVMKGNTALLKTVQDGFDQITQGEYDAIQRKWFGTATDVIPFLRYAGIGAAIVLLIALILFAWNYSLRRMVRRRTSELKALFAAMDDVVIVVDRSGRYLDVLTPESNLLITSARAMVGKLASELLPADSAQLLVEAVQRALVEKDPEQIEYSLTIQGKQHWFSGTISPVDTDKAILVAHDFTQRKQTEEELRENEVRYRALVDASPDAIFLAQEGKFIFLNSAALRMFGASSPEDLIGTSFLDRVHPDFYPIIHKRLERLKNNMKNTPIEMTMLGLDGRVILTESNSILLKYEGQPTLVVFSHDITSRKKAEGALLRTQFMVDNVTQPVVAMAKDGTLTYANDAASQIVGLPPGKLVGLKMWEFDRSFTPQRWQEHWNQVVAADTLTLESVLTAADGKQRWIEISVNHVKFENEEFLVNFSRDITDRKQAEEHIRQANRELVAAYDATLAGWAAALELRERETKEHSQRVVELTLKLAQVFGISAEEQVHIRRGAQLHDIGKMGIPDSILLKEGKLSDDEWEKMRTHPILAYKLLSQIPYLLPSLDIPYFHHEWYDGSGYPQGLKGDDIPLAARIFAVVDVWDALSYDRPYSKAWERERIIAHLQEQSGTHFDPQVVEAFLKLLSEDDQQ